MLRFIIPPPSGAYDHGIGNEDRIIPEEEEEKQEEKQEVAVVVDDLEDCSEGSNATDDQKAAKHRKIEKTWNTPEKKEDWEENLEHLELMHFKIGCYASKFMVCFLHLLNSACTMYLKFFEKIAVMYRRGFACKGDDDSRCNYQGVPLYWHRCTSYLGRICYNCSPVIPSHQRLSWQSWQQWKITQCRYCQSARIGYLQNMLLVYICLVYLSVPVHLAPVYSFQC